MTLRPLRLLVALLGLLTGAALPAQSPPGHCLLTLTASGLPRPLIAFLDPLNGALRFVTDPGNLLAGPVRAALALGPNADLLLAINNPATGQDLVVRARLGGTAISAVTPFATGFQGTITNFVSLRGAGFAIGTNLGVSRIAQTGGVPVPVLSGPVCRDLVLSGTTLTALVTDATSGAAALVVIPVSGGNSVAHPLSLVRPRALGWTETTSVYLVGTDAGDVFRVDSASFVPTLLVSPGRGPIGTFAFATNHEYSVFSTPGQVQTLDGALVGAPMPVPAGALATEIDWVPFTSSFTVEDQGCPGSAGLPVIGSVGGAPFPGNSRFTITLTNAHPSSTAVLLLGVDRLVLDLAPFGAPGCRVLTTPLLDVAAPTSALGRAILGLPVPADAALAGGGVSVQWLVLDPSNALGLVTSARGRADL